MSSAAVYLTSDEAKIFTFKIDGNDMKHFWRHGAKHPGEGHHHSRGQSDTDKFLEEIAEYLMRGGAERWLVLGPGLAKTKFQSLMQAKHPGQAAKIIGVEAMDKASDGQIRDFAHKFFRRDSLYKGA